jgi:hypothetical protein
MARRTEVQLALLVMGLIVWGYGQRTDNGRLTWFGVAFFAVAFVVRFAKRKSNADEPEESVAEHDDGPPTGPPAE